MQTNGIHDIVVAFVGADGVVLVVTLFAIYAARTQTSLPASFVARVEAILSRLLTVSFSTQAGLSIAVFLASFIIDDRQADLVAIISVLMLASPTFASLFVAPRIEKSEKQPAHTKSAVRDVYANFEATVRQHLTAAARGDQFSVMAAVVDYREPARGGLVTVVSGNSVTSFNVDGDVRRLMYYLCSAGVLDRGAPWIGTVRLVEDPDTGLRLALPVVHTEDDTIAD